MAESTLDLVKYYANLLIFQYQNKPRAYDTILATATPIVMSQTSVQTISFSPAPTSGTFVLSYDENNTSALNWNDSASTIQTALRLVPALSTITVTGSIAAGLTVTFTGLTLVADMLVVQNNSLLASSNPVIITIEETDQTLPLAVQNAFNIDTAVGVQLDILGKYAGVTRTVNTSTQTIVLNDSDFRTLIKFAVVQNNAGSSLNDIETNLNIFFPGKFVLTDYKNMTMSYLFSSTIGSADFFRALVSEKLIPKPMAVGITTIVPPVIEQYFGYGTYQNGNENGGAKPYNTYENFNTDWFYLDYNNFIT